MASRSPLTTTESARILREFAAMKLRAEELAKLIESASGPKHQITIRAREVAVAIQRLEWAIQRDEEGKGGTPSP